ncbi:MAG: thioredoxin domain-containing protein [Deltaproteobacteria bacterium]|nr:thioredoxin domain-containing protein [Deltaproteobacteria bacterium]
MIARKISVYILFFVALTIFNGPASAQIKGDFESLGKIPAPHSLEVVQIEEFLNFTCPHCNNFRTLSKDLFKKYGKRIKHINNPILFPRQNDYALRLFYVGQKAGKEAEVKEMIFDSTFVFGVNIYDPATVEFMARSLGIGDSYQKQGNEPWVTELISKTEFRAKEALVNSTPTLVLAGTIKISPKVGMQEFINNLDNLLGQLLK